MIIEGGKCSQTEDILSAAVRGWRGWCTAEVWEEEEEEEEVEDFSSELEL